MKNNEKKRAERLVNALSFADDKYVDEASPDAVFSVKAAKVKHKKTNIKRIVLIAASLCLLISIIITSVLIPLLRRDDASRLPIIDPESADKAELSNDYASFLEKLAAYKNKSGNVILDSTGASPDEEDSADRVTDSPVEDAVPEEGTNSDESY